MEKCQRKFSAFVKCEDTHKVETQQPEFPDQIKKDIILTDGTNVVNMEPSESHSLIEKKESGLAQSAEPSDNQNNEGRWTEEENWAYLNFLLENKSIATHKKFRRSRRLFKNMSIYMKSRTATQCRSHHQKMLRRFKTVHRLLNFLKSQFNNQARTGSSAFKVQAEPALTQSIVTQPVSRDELMNWLQLEAQRIQALQLALCSLPFNYLYYSYPQTTHAHKQNEIS